MCIRDSPGVKQKVIIALGKIGDPRAGEFIAEFLKRDLDPGMRGTAIFALADTAGPEVIPSLERVAEETSDPRIEKLAMIAIQEIRQRLAPAWVKVEPTYIKMQRLKAEAEAKKR